MTGGDSQTITALIRRQYKKTRQRNMTPEDWQELEIAYRDHYALSKKMTLEIVTAAHLLEQLLTDLEDAQLRRLVYAQYCRFQQILETFER